jgi:hypothetical protein
MVSFRADVKDRAWETLAASGATGTKPSAESASRLIPTPSPQSGERVRKRRRQRSGRPAGLGSSSEASLAAAMRRQASCDVTQLVPRHPRGAQAISRPSENIGEKAQTRAGDARAR